MAIADVVIKQTTSCMKCGNKASISFRQTEDTNQVLVGDTEYISMCWDCWYYHMKEKENDIAKRGYF